MMYLNNAATTYPKPQCVTDAHTAALSAPPAGQFRSSGQGRGKDVFTGCRENLGRLLGIGSPERIYFTSGATDSLNQLFHGMERRGKKILVTQTEHNSVLRPLYNGMAAGAEVEILPCDKYGQVSPEVFEERISPEAGLLVLNHCSNVTGMIQDAARFGEIAEKHGVLFMLDASQSAGCIPIDCDGWHVDALVFTGHKGLFGPQGTGLLLCGGEQVVPLMQGGTGSESIRQQMPDFLPDHLEAGTHNVAGIAGLLEGLRFVERRGTQAILSHEQGLIHTLADCLSQIPNVEIFFSPEHQAGVLSLRAGNRDCEELGELLGEGGYALRAGLHCAPYAHETAGTLETGTLRASVSPFNTEQEMFRFADELARLVKT